MNRIKDYLDSHPSVPPTEQCVALAEICSGRLFFHALAPQVPSKDELATLTKFLAGLDMDYWVVFVDSLDSHALFNNDGSLFKAMGSLMSHRGADGVAACMRKHGEGCLDSKNPYGFMREFAKRTHSLGWLWKYGVARP